MTQREEFEEWYKKVGISEYECTDEQNESLFNYSLMVWQAAKAHGVPEWIPVSERLPYDDELVLVYDSEGTHGYIYTLRVYREFFDKFKYVTHWMPLPSAPEQNK